MAVANGESRLRHRLEKPVFLFSVFLNAAIMVGAIFVAVKATDTGWLKAHPVIAKNVKRFRTAAIAGILLAPGVFVLRNTRRATIRGNSLRASASQFGPVYNALESQCRKLGTKVPLLYVTDFAISGPSEAYTAWNQDYIVLNAKYLPAKLEGKMDIVEFFLGRELGAIRLGHTKWWNEVLLAYIDRIPMLRNPLSHVRTLSRDRYGAYLAPQGLSAIVALASSPRILSSVNIAEYIKEAQRNRGFWFRLSGMSRRLPTVSERLAALTEFGLFQVDERTRRSGTAG